MSESTDVRSADYKFKKQIGHLKLSVSDIPSEEGGGTYMTRLIAQWRELGRTARLHVIRQADGDRCLHDHPWSFVTVVLWGGYTEEYETEVILFYPRSPARLMATVLRERKVWPLSINYRPLHFKHRITKLHARVAITLVFTSPEMREWGFYTSEGWRPWTAFLKAGKAMRALWCAK